MALQKINKQNVSDIVYQQLEQCILEGIWQPGEKIPSENTLAEQLGVSRVTIRNALQRLSSIGLVEARQGGGTYVKVNDEGQMLQLIKPILMQTKPDVKYFLEYRLAVEPEIAALAAQRVTPEQLTQIQAHLQAYEDAVKSGDTDSIEPQDAHLHYAIAVASQNPLFIKIYEIIKDIYARNLSQIVQDVGADAGIRYHKKIVNAIALGNAADARTFMRKHLSETVRLYTQEPIDA